MFRIELVQLDLMHPETFQYRVFSDEVFVAAFDTLDEANSFIVENGGQPVGAVGGWRKDFSATAGSEYR